MQRHVDETATVKRHDWESTLSPLLGARTETLWRRHSDAVNSSLIAQWLPAGACRHLLKTDLFDEAMARRLPFADATFDVVVSNSTLDHFDARDDIRIALRGLHRVLRPGGTLVLTLDNLANPLVALRNALPARLLRRLGLIDYPVGVTCGPWRLRRLLRESGFVVLDSTALLHCLRVFEVAALRRLPADLPSVKQARILRRLARWERLAGWPPRFITGHYVGVCARKV